MMKFNLSRVSKELVKSQPVSQEKVKSQSSQSRISYFEVFPKGSLQKKKSKISDIGKKGRVGLRPKTIFLTGKK